MDAPLLSVCLITYNHAKFIRKAIEGILIQKVKFSWDIIIADDCSTDGTREIVLEYQKRYPGLIKLILHEKNVGPVQNLKDVFSVLNSKYVAYIDGDDYWTDEYKLQAQVDLMENNPQYPMCFTNSVIVDSEGRVIKESRVPDDKKKNIKQRDIIEGFCPPSNTVVFRNELLGSLPAEYSKTPNGDYFLFIYFTEFGEAAYLDRNTAAYRKHLNSAWSSIPEFNQVLNYRQTCKILLKLYGHKYREILSNAVNGSTVRLIELAKQDNFLDNGYWTPQSKMLQTLRDIILSLNVQLFNALSIDDNPAIEKLLKSKNADLEVLKTSYPEYDAQNLHQFNDNMFDVVFSHQVLEHIPKPWVAAKEMLRVLKKGGIGIHTSCAFNPRHGLPVFNDYYRFLPDGLEQLFDGIETIHKGEWGNKQAILYNVGIDDGNGALGGRRFVKQIGEPSDGLYPWHTWIIFRKK